MVKKRDSIRIILIILMFLFTTLLFPQNYNASATTTTIIRAVPSINMPSSVNSGQSISASWNSISGASGYSIALLDQTTGAKVTNNTTKTSYTVNANTLVAGHSYKFWVGVTNAAGTNAGSAVYFTVNQSMPIVALPRISMPSSVNADQSITASWNSISGASSYSIALLDQTTGVKITNSITKTSYTANANTLTAGHSYKFWVGVTNEAGTNAGSEAYFTVNQLTVSVTSVSLNKTTIPLNVGSSETLTATVLPFTVINKTVSWKSSNTAVATVDTNGKVTGVGVGTAIITVTTIDGNKAMTCSVTVMGRPSVTTGIASSVTFTAATLNGTLDGNGGFDVTDCGFYWGTSSRSMTNKASLGNQGANKGSRSINILALIGSTTYYYQMYAINEVGEVKGSTGSFKTLNIPLKPTIIMTMSPNKSVYTKGETVIITGTGTNCDHMSLEINGKAVDGSIKTGNQYTYAYTFITTGKYEFKLKARNGADNDINFPVVYSDIKPVTVTLKINGIVYRKYTDKKLAVGLATVKLNDSDDPKFKTTTDLNGRFSFDSVMPGSVMSIEKAGYDKIIDIPINENSNIGDIVSEICYTNPKEVYTLNGRVIGKYSEYGIGGVNVEVIDKDNTFHWFATTDANGNYEIKGVGPAIYGVIFTKAGFVDTSGKSLVTLSLNSIYRNTTTSNVELIDMNNAYLITGRVAEKDSNKAIFGAVVKIVGQDKFTDKTDANGYYHIYGVSGNNPWKLDVTYSGYISKQVDAAVGLANSTVNIVMEKPVTAVSLNKPSTIINVGASETLIATISPATGADKTVSWKSDKPGIAVVNLNGKVTGLSAGVAKITVTTNSGKNTMTCVVTVIQSVAYPEIKPIADATKIVEKSICTEYTIDKKKYKLVYIKTELFTEGSLPFKLKNISVDIPSIVVDENNRVVIDSNIIKKIDMMMTVKEIASKKNEMKQLITILENLKTSINNYLLAQNLIFAGNELSGFAGKLSYGAISNPASKAEIVGSLAKSASEYALSEMNIANANTLGKNFYCFVMFNSYIDSLSKIQDEYNKVINLDESKLYLYENCIDVINSVSYASDEFNNTWNSMQSTFIKELPNDWGDAAWKVFGGFCKSFNEAFADEAVKNANLTDKLDKTLKALGKIKTLGKNTVETLSTYNKIFSEYNPEFKRYLDQQDYINQARLNKSYFVISTSRVDIWLNNGKSFK